MPQAEELLGEGRVADALQALQETVRNEPAEARHRVFLFQLLSILGQWKRAITQLNVAAEMDPINMLMAEVGRVALNCEAFRAEVFAGRRSPMVFGEPEDWCGWMLQANQLAAEGKVAESQELRMKALEEAPATSGTIDGTAFEWIADADMRMGPMLEALVEGRYYWIPFHRIHRIEIDQPTDLRDLVWASARFTWSNGGAQVGLIPSRYTGTEQETEGALLLGRQTVWRDLGDELFVGIGQRMFATDTGEYPLLAVREIILDTLEPGAVIHRIDQEGSVEGASIDMTPSATDRSDG